MSMKYYCSYNSPVGALHLVSDGKALIAATFHRDDSDVSDAVLDPSAEPFAEARRQLDEYFQGKRKTFELPINLRGTSFQVRAWKALTEIPFGETISYKAQAERVGSVPRAVGLANGQNPIPIIVPCHRVIGADGSLVGYGGGLDLKRALLQFEALVNDFGPQPFPMGKRQESKVIVG
jgi:methylated-DNA-[protein]-cysteine S-methyltransferase